MDESKSETRQAEELKPGEKAFSVILFLVGVFFFWQALDLWLRTSPPRASSAAALPLFTTGLWVLMSLAAIIENIRKRSPLSKHRSYVSKLKFGISYAIPEETAVIIGIIAAYSILVFFRINFYVISSLFLFGTMCFYTRRSQSSCGLKPDSAASADLKRPLSNVVRAIFQMSSPYIMNILWTAIFMLFIYAVFQRMFNIVFF